MTPRDERLAGRAPVWAWSALQEDPPYPPGYVPRQIELSPEDAAYSRHRMAELDWKNNPDAPPPNPDNYVVFAYDPETPDPYLLDELHEVRLDSLRSRLPVWTRTAQEIPPARRLLYWQTKREAYHLIAAHYHVSGDLMYEAEFVEALDEAVRLAADAAAWSLPDTDAHQGEDPTPRRVIYDYDKIRTHYRTIRDQHPSDLAAREAVCDWYAAEQGGRPHESTVRRALGERL